MVDPSVPLVDVPDLLEVDVWNGHLFGLAHAVSSVVLVHCVARGPSEDQRSLQKGQKEHHGFESIKKSFNEAFGVGEALFKIPFEA